MRFFTMVTYLLFCEHFTTNIHIKPLGAIYTGATKQFFQLHQGRNCPKPGTHLRLSEPRPTYNINKQNHYSYVQNFENSI